jgi:hypothetical protein
MRMVVVASVGLAIQLALPLSVQADQAILSRERLFELDPGQSVEFTSPIVISRYGIPTVVFDGAAGFADNETVTATITLSAHDGLGSVRLLSSSVLTGTTPTGYSLDPPDPSFSEFTFDPPVSFRYTAPSAATLDCDARREKVVHASLGIAATLVGSAGTTATFSAETFPGVVMFDIYCPAETYIEEPTSTALPAHALPDPTTTASRSPSPAPTAVATASPLGATTPPASAALSAQPVALVSAESVEPRTDPPAPAPATDLTLAALVLAVVAVIVSVLAGSIAWRARYR